MAYGDFNDAPRGNFRTARDIFGEDISADAQARNLRGETVGRLGRALRSVVQAYVRGLSYGQHYAFRPF